ncbi:TPA: hypothetical protein I7735_21810 [Vibrio vulnificus]|nr:hypothetical protein CRN60_07705 [Vibrio vulnificus]HAS8394002.1 hypothetical protein [Vibrio vulnificus]
MNEIVLLATYLANPFSLFLTHRSCCSILMHLTKIYKKNMVTFGLSTIMNILSIFDQVNKDLNSA